jgi:hypothetical protein
MYLWRVLGLLMCLWRVLGLLMCLWRVLGLLMCLWRVLRLQLGPARQPGWLLQLRLLARHSHRSMMKAAGRTVRPLLLRLWLHWLGCKARVPERVLRPRPAQRLRLLHAQRR